ncbi:MAG: hypothetical protein HOM18_13240 [Candidatus Marinimicrobia bacterium]|nr:hypothetical protein [Candidatus Neomarinimicrobiota bacterium]
MAKAIASQASFIAGELDPRLAARIDTESYTKGAETLTNVICLGQGGVKRRPGMKYIDTVTESAVRLVTFEFNITQTYLLVFVDSKMYIYMDGVLQTNINASGNDYLVTPYSATEIKEMTWTQSADTLIMCHNDYVPRKIVRGATDTDWTISSMTFTYYPTYDFNQDYDAATFTCPASAKVVGDVITISLDAGHNPVTTEHVGGMFEGNAGVVRITSVDTTSGAQTLTGTVLQEFTNTNTISGVDASLEEPVWTATHGYPGSVTFHESRLWLSNSTARPQTLWGSVTGDFFNFDRGFGDATDSIDITMDTDQVNAIYHLVSGRHLQIFTSGGEFFIPDRPIKPASVGVLRQTRFGVLKAVPPINVDGATMFIQRNGKQVREYLFTYTENSYVSTEVNLLAPHLINSPVSMAAQTGDVDNEGNYLYIVNADGTVAVFITNRAESVTAWTRFTTDGDIKDVAVVEDVVYFHVKRTMNGSTIYTIEALDNNTYTDSAVHVVNSPASATVTGLDHLNGQECRVRADSSVMDNATPASGSITLARTATNIEVGMNYELEVKTMPVNITFGSGPINATKRRILRVSAQLYQANGIKINGKAVTDKGFGVGVLNSTPTGFTGMKTVPMLGYSKTTQVTVTQSDPTPMTLLGLTLEIQAQGG